MPRNQQPLTKGVGQAAPVAAPRADIYQPNPYYVRTPDRSRELASALTAALGIAENIHAAREQKAGAEGVADAQAGAVDPTKAARSEAYRRAVETTSAQAEYATLRANLSQEVEQAVEDGQDLEAINGIIERTHAKFLYDENGELVRGFDDPEVAKAVLPGLAKARAELVEAARERIRVRTEEKFLGDKAIELRAQYAETGKIDWLSLNEQTSKVFLGRTNAAMLELVGALAVEAGNGSLFDEVPDRWANGSPTFKVSPQFADKLEQYRNAAYRQGDAIESAKAKAVAAEQKQADNTFGSDVTLMALSGDLAGARQRLIKFKDFGASDELARTLSSFITTVENAEEGGEIDIGGIAGFATQIFSDPDALTIKDFTDAWKAGRFGSGTKALEKYTSLVEDWRNQKSQKAQNPRFRSDEYDRDQAILKAVYLPSQGAGLPASPEEQQHLAIVQRAYSALVAGGMDYPAALKKVQQDYPLLPGSPLTDYARQAGFTGGEPLSAVDPAAVSKDLNSLSPKDLKARYGTRAADLLGLVESGKLDPAQYDALLEKIAEAP